MSANNHENRRGYSRLDPLLLAQLAKRFADFMSLHNWKVENCSSFGPDESSDDLEEDPDGDRGDGNSTELPDDEATDE